MYITRIVQLAQEGSVKSSAEQSVIARLYEIALNIPKHILNNMYNIHIYCGVPSHREVSVYIKLRRTNGLFGKK